MTAPPPPVVGPVEARIQGLVTEVFDSADLQAVAPTPQLTGRAAAFILLGHAEIEYAIEVACYRVSGLLRNSQDPAIALLAWGFAIAREGGEGFKTQLRNAPIADLATAYDNLVAGNNGIKEKNIQSLLTPIGVDLVPLKAEMFALEDFGRRRGDLAHKPLSSWSTTDLPSAHVAGAVQTGRAADTVITAIQLKHAAIAPTMRPRTRVWRRTMAAGLRRLADKLDSRSH